MSTNTLGVLKYSTFESIPDAASMARFGELACSARQKVWEKEAHLINEEEWQCLGVMDPDTARTVHRELREQQEKQQQQPQQKQTHKRKLALKPPDYDLASETFDEWCDKNAMRPVPFAV